MKEHPILFNSEMVRAILDGRKTQARRVIKPQPEILIPPIDAYYNIKWKGQMLAFEGDIAPYAQYKVGDKLWVRETFLQEGSSMLMPGGTYQDIWHSKIEYVADGARPRILNPKYSNARQMVKRPSVHLPKKHARIWLEITGVRVERAQDISENDAVKEGYPSVFSGQDLARHWFQELWDSINKKRGFGWEKNPFVWVIEFKRA